MMISLTKEVTIAVKAPPTATPTAKSTTLPRLINSLNSLTTFGSFFLTSSRPLVIEPTPLERFLERFLVGELDFDFMIKILYKINWFLKSRKRCF